MEATTDDTTRQAALLEAAAAAAQREQWLALCEQALDALKYHREQTRPIERTDAAIHALQSALGPCVQGRAQSNVPVSDEATQANVQLTEGLGPDADDDECSAPPRVTDAPADVWLVYGDLDRDATHLECCRDGEVTWCDAKQYDSDVHYVRGDRYDDLRTALVQLHDRASELAQVCNEVNDHTPESWRRAVLRIGNAATIALRHNVY